MNERKTEGSTGRRMVTLLLTRHHDPFSNYICHVSKSPYSHASISIDPEQKKFYSFNKKGFVEEYPGNRKRSNISMSIRIFVTEEVYTRLKNEIDHFPSFRCVYYGAV